MFINIMVVVVRLYWFRKQLRTTASKSDTTQSCYQVLICEDILDRDHLRIDEENCQPPTVTKAGNADLELHTYTSQVTSLPETALARTTTITFDDTTNAEGGGRVPSQHSRQRSAEYLRLPDASAGTEIKDLECEGGGTRVRHKWTSKCSRRIRNFF